MTGRNQIQALTMGLLILGSSAVVRADLITDWNERFLAAVRTETTPPPLAARNLAILHIAIFDAVNGVTGKYQPYSYEPPGRVEASVAAAVSAAAREVAVTLYPSQKAGFEALFNKSLADVPDGSLKTAGLSLGTNAAHAILSERRADGASTTVPYVPSTALGQWRRTPPYRRPPELPHWRYVKPFALTNAAQFRPPGPPALNSSTYAEDVGQVKRLGAKKSSERTAEQSHIALFWSDFSYTVTPPGHWNEIARRVALDRQTSLEENARIFVALNIALADAAIVVWDAKYHYNFWRPITAIREAHRGDNPGTAREPDWEPLLVTPAFPEYVSGHSTFSGAAAAVLAHAFGSDKIHFTVGCDALPGVTRSYDSFRATAEEIGMSRIYGGIHFMSANRDGLAAGKAVGEYVVRNFPLSAKRVTARFSLVSPAAP